MSLSSANSLVPYDWNRTTVPDKRGSAHAGAGRNRLQPFRPQNSPGPAAFDPSAHPYAPSTADTYTASRRMSAARFDDIGIQIDIYA
jgi:hypothetical protein